MKNLTVCLGLMLVWASCGKAEQKPTIGIVVSTLNNPFFVALRDGAADKAKSLGYDIIALDSQNDVSKELANIEDLVTRRVSAILINPVDSESSSRAAQQPINANIPVISLDRTLNGVDVATHVASDNTAGGAMAAEFIKAKVPANARLIELQGIPGTSAARDRGQGFNQALQGSSLTIAARQAADFDRAKGLAVTEALLQANQDIAAIFAHNDEMALGALRAAEAAQKNIMVVGFDATPDALASIKEGKLAATIAQQPDQIGAIGVEQADNIIKGKTVEKSIPVALTVISE